MKTLLLDVGNSRLKWALADGVRRSPAQAVAHDGDPASALSAIKDDGIERIRIANVTGARHSAALAEALRARFGCAAEFAVSEAVRLGLHSAYIEPQRLGVDRWLGLLAAWSRHRNAVCVASCGTALTFDAVDDDGHHLGGVISSGLLTAQQAVLGATRFTASAPDQAYARGLGDDTEACVRQGALHAGAGLLERLAARQPGASLFLTGGDADLLRPHLEGDWQIVPDLVLEGLQALDA